MTAYTIQVKGLDEEFAPIEAADAEGAVRSFVRENVSRFPDVFDWDITVVAPEERFRAEVVEIKDTGAGNARDVVIKVTRVG